MNSRIKVKKDWCGCPLLIATYRDILLLFVVWICVALYLCSFAYQNLGIVLLNSLQYPSQYYTNWLAISIGLLITIYFVIYRFYDVLGTGIKTVLIFFIFIFLTLLIDNSIWNSFYTLLLPSSWIIYLKQYIFPKEPLIPILYGRIIIAIIGIITVRSIRQLWNNTSNRLDEQKNKIQHNE